VPQRFRTYTHKLLSTILCAAAIFAAGCHGPGNISYYGTAWISVTDQPGDYVSYIITIDSITLTRSDGVVVTAAATPEIVDLAQIKNYSELWSSETVPDGTYTSATITLDYTNAVISVMVNGKPQTATLYDYATGTATPTTYSITVDFDAAHQPTITPTYASTSAVLMSLDFDLAASGLVDLSTSPAKVYVRPIVSIGMQAPDTHLIRIRGPLINSSTNVNTYTAYLRPFYDEANNIGTVTMFSQPNTVYTLNGQSYVGNSGLDALSVLSAGITMTAGYTTFQTDYNPLNGATAGRFNLVYVVAGSTLEDVYTEGITGDVIARSGNTLTLQSSTLILNTADTFEYLVDNAQVLLGGGTIVTADDNSRLTGLNYNSIAVGQRITARGIWNGVVSNGTTQVTVIDSTGTSSTNTGSVRIQPTELWGTLVSSGAGTATLDVQTVNDWPASDFTFTGNGATAPSPASFLVNTTLTGLPAGVVPGDPLWISGYMSPFGTAPPDFTAYSANDESSVQIAGAAIDGGASTAPGNGSCGIGSQVCVPAVMSVIWAPTAKVSAPFTSVSDAGFTIDPTKVDQGVIRIGPEIIDLTSVTSPVVVATTLPATSTFAPRFMVGDPYTSTTTTTVTSSSAFATYSDMADFVTKLQSLLTASTPALQMAASGIYNRTTNTFTATSIDFVL
jgi:uncharacterized protein DUF4382